MSRSVDSELSARTRPGSNPFLKHRNRFIFVCSSPFTPLKTSTSGATRSPLPSSSPLPGPCRGVRALPREGGAARGGGRRRRREEEEERRGGGGLWAGCAARVRASSAQHQGARSRLPAPQRGHGGAPRLRPEDQQNRSC